MSDVISKDTVRRDLAPTGTIRFGINVANPFLTRKESIFGELAGVAIDLAKAVAGSLELPFEFVTYDAAGKLFDAVDTGAWDVTFLAIEPARAEKVLFTSPYATIEGTYLVKSLVDFPTLADVDRPGVRIAVGRNAAYDLFLTRNLKHARLVRADKPSAALSLFTSGEADVVAGVRQGLTVFANGDGRLHVLPGCFMSIEQGIAVPKAKQFAAAYLQRFLDDEIKLGRVDEIIARHRQN